MLRAFVDFALETRAREIAIAHLEAMAGAGVAIPDHCNDAPYDDLLSAFVEEGIVPMLKALGNDKLDSWVVEGLEGLDKNVWRKWCPEAKIPRAAQLDLFRQAVLTVLPDFTPDAHNAIQVALAIERVVLRGVTVYIEENHKTLEKLGAETTVLFAQLEEAQRIAHVGSWEWDVPNDRIRWSDELYRLFDTHQDAFPATYETYLALLHPADRDHVHRVVDETIRSGADAYLVEHRVIHRDGSLRWIQGRGRVTRDAGGNLVRLAGTALDITDQKAAEQLKDDFLSVVSHELRTPLNFIMGFSSVLEDGIGGKLSDRQSDYVGRIREGAERMSRLVENLLAMGSLQAGMLDLISEPVDLAVVAGEVAEGMRYYASLKRLRFETDISGPIALDGDSHRLFQAVANLCENAIKFTPEGGTVRLGAKPAGAVGRVEVSDTGVGIEPDDQSRLFERLRRPLKGRSDSRSTGTGLGLSIAKNLIEAHGGRIEVVSAPGSGTTFWFEIPLTRKSLSPSGSQA
jgi:signal transduction histidine kinase